MKLPKLNKIYKMDCIEFMKTLPDKSINLIVTSPPYNIGIDYSGTYDDNRPFDEYKEFCTEVYKEMKRVIKDDGLCAIVVGNQRESGIPFHHYFLLDEAGLNVMKTVIWYKGCYYIQSEFIFVCGDKKQYKKCYDKRGDGFFANGGFSTIWQMTFPKGESQEALQHNACFITTIPTNFININTEKGDIVYDPFMGSGTTGVAAVRTGRNFLGTEINDKYINFSNERIKKEIEIKKNDSKQIDMFEEKTEQGKLFDEKTTKIK